MRLYLGRRIDGEYELGNKKLDWDARDGFKDVSIGNGKGSYITSFCDERFEKITGVKLKRGEIVKVKNIKWEIQK